VITSVSAWNSIIKLNLNRGSNMIDLFGEFAILCAATVLTGLAISLLTDKYSQDK
jgi:hypothetical protein